MLDDPLLYRSTTLTWKALGTLRLWIPSSTPSKRGEGKSVYPIHLSQGATFNGFFNGYDGLTAGVAVMGVKYDDESRKVVNLLEQDDVKRKPELPA